jgi:polyketide cyclase/dehydrase/lipid transport protein
VTNRVADQPFSAAVVESVLVGASAEDVWDLLVDWERQQEWMLGTRVRGTRQGGRGVGGGIEGFTGIGRVGFLDTMDITVWEPPVRCVVRHTGRVVRGAGAFEIEPLGPHRSRFVWSEWLDLPFGALGTRAWPLVRPAVRLGARMSLRRFARVAEETSFRP